MSNVFMKNVCMSAVIMASIVAPLKPRLILKTIVFHIKKPSSRTMGGRPIDVEALGVVSLTGDEQPV